MRMGMGMEMSISHDSHHVVSEPACALQWLRQNSQVLQQTVLFDEIYSSYLRTTYLSGRCAPEKLPRILDEQVLARDSRISRQ